MTSCQICGKLLTDERSVERGIGPICDAKIIAQGWTIETVAERRQEMSLSEPPEGYISAKEAGDTLREKNVTIGWFVKAIGGDRALSEPLDPRFEPVYVGRRRWFDAWVISDEAIELMDLTYNRHRKAEADKAVE